MKNSNIHNGLENKELRDFLSKNIVTTWTQESQISARFPRKNMNSVEIIEYEIKILKERLEVEKVKEAIKILMKKYGWLEFDVSNETDKENYDTWHMNFIGTEKEYEMFISNLNKNQ